MNNYNGYKLKPKGYSIQPNDIIIRVIGGSGTSVPIGQIAIALGDSYIVNSLHKMWRTYYSDWRAIETKKGSEARADDTVYCIKNTGASCKQHDSFVISHYYSNCIYPINDHKLLDGTLTRNNWSWPANNFVVLVKADAKEIQEFPCFRRGIESRHVVKFVSPRDGTVVFNGKSQFDINYTSTWVDYNNTRVWEPCADPALSHIPVDPFEAKPGDYVEWADESTPSLSMTKGQLYKVIKASSNALVTLTDYNQEDAWLKESFKRVLKPESHKPFIDQPASNLRGSFETNCEESLAYALRVPISYIAIDSMMNKPTQTKQNSKGKQMNSNLFTDILKLLMQTEQTDLEKAPSTYAFFYNNEGEYEGTARVVNEAEAKALLQKPEHLGYTMRIYSFSDEFTTQIPVVSTIKKTVVAKPARKPRATKA